MNKTAIKNFAIWARNKLIADVSYKAGLLGITEKGIKSPLPQSTQTVQFFDVGTKEPSSITGIEIQQRKKLVEEIEKKAKQSDYASAFTNVIEEVAYTWFNRLIAIRFMEVNDYLPTRLRVLSSDSSGKAEPDLVTHAMEANLDYSAYEKDRIIQLKNENKLDELFRMLFIKQCNALNTNLPMLFEKTSDYTELLLNVSFTDKEGVVFHLINDISEDDFNVSKEGQVEIIGWLYQYYISDLNDLVYDGTMAKNRISKDLLPAATTIYTPDWAIRYMLENSLGRLWLDGHPNNQLKNNWKFYLEEISQEENIQKKLDIIREEYRKIKPEEIRVIDPCMGSGHILVYAFELLLQIYESYGYSQKEAARSIVENNLFGLDIDNRAHQLSYFAVMMKARQYNRKILDGNIRCHLYAIQESNDISNSHIRYFGCSLSELERKIAINELEQLINIFRDAKEYGSILKVKKFNWDLLYRFIQDIDQSGQLSIDSVGIEITSLQLNKIVEIGEILNGKFDVVVTNPPYFGSLRFSNKLLKYVNDNYPTVKSDLSMVMYKKAIDDFSKKNRFVAFITTTSWMFLKSFEDLREYVINHFDFVSILDFGTELFEGKVGHNPIVAWINRNSSTKQRITGIRLVQYCYSRRDEKESQFFEKNNRYYPDQENFKKIPGVPIVYWISNKFAQNFDKGISIDSISDFTGSQNITANNDKFLRFVWEVSKNDIGINRDWAFYAKGGDFRKWYGNIEYVVNTSPSAINYYKSNSSSNYLKERYWFSEGITYSAVTSKGTGFRYYPAIGGFDKGGPTICRVENMHYILGLLNSKVASMILNMMNPTINLQVKDVKSLPILISTSEKDEVSKIVKENIELSRIDWNCKETSIDFTTHPLIENKVDKKLESAFLRWEEITNNNFDKLKNNEEKLNQIFINIYGLQDELLSNVDNSDVTISKADLGRDVRSLISYAIGCIFGRYSINIKGIAFAGGDWNDSNYSDFIPDQDNILPITDEEYFSDDIVGLFTEFIKKAFGVESLEDNLDFIANALGNKGNNSREIIRNYFLQDFFKDHCAIYSVTGAGKRPIYWLFESGKQNGFKALIYMHRYDANTIGNLRIDYLHRMQRIYENEITRMQDTIENSRDAREVTAATKRKEKLIKQLQETKEYDEKIAHLALARTSIDLDDGVKVNYEKVQTDRDGKKLDVLAKI